MAVKPRLFLFYGTDSRGSLLAVRKWEEVFRQKYGEATRYILEGDEIGADALRKSLAEIISGQTLFATPKLIIIKRSTSGERAPSFSASKELVSLLKSQLEAFDETVTLAIWEDHNLKSEHPLVKTFTAWNTGVAELKQFQVPTDREVLKVAKAYLATQKKELGPEASKWLQDQYTAQGKRSRLSKKIKMGDEPAEEERVWWLYQLLDGAILRSKDVISLEDLKSGAEVVTVAVGTFEVVNAVGGKRWKEVIELLDRLEQDADADYFALLAALRWYFRKNNHDPLAIPALQLLSEIELLSKNFSVSLIWLFTLFIHRLIKVSRGQDLQPIVEPRRLWLSQMYRS